MSIAACEQMEARLAARQDDLLDVTELRELEQHLNDCADCSALASSLDDTAPPVAPVFPLVDPEAYELGPVIGYGGMGKIREARDRRLGRRIAIKELLFNVESLAARFVREARVAASLQHPNIVPVYDVGCWHDGTPFYTMRLITGRTLYEALREATSVGERLELLPSLVAVADAVAFAHACGVVHRDLSPANVLLGDFGETVVIDWGLAKDLRGNGERVATPFQTGHTEKVLTVKGSILGSPAYMPPEQAEGLDADPRSDVYSLGALLYHLLAGHPPYVGTSSRDIVDAVRTRAPLPIDKSAAPAGLVAIANQAMAREPSARFANGHALARQLRQFQATSIARTSRRRWFA